MRQTLSDAEVAALILEHHSSGDANECCGDAYHCGYMWPCPTYLLAVEVRDSRACADIAFRQSEGGTIR